MRPFSFRCWWLNFWPLTCLWLVFGLLGISLLCSEKLGMLKAEYEAWCQPWAGWLVLKTWLIRSLHTTEPPQSLLELSWCSGPVGTHNLVHNMSSVAIRSSRECHCNPDYGEFPVHIISGIMSTLITRKLSYGILGSTKMSALSIPIIYDLLPYQQYTNIPA